MMRAPSPDRDRRLRVPDGPGVHLAGVEGRGACCRAEVDELDVLGGEADALERQQRQAVGGTALRDGDLLALEVAQRLDGRVLGHDDVLGRLGDVGAVLGGDDLEAVLLSRSGDRRHGAHVAEVDVARGGSLNERWSVVEPRELDLVGRIVERAGHLGQLLAAVAAVVADGEGVLTPLGVRGGVTRLAQWALGSRGRGAAGGEDARHREQRRGAEHAEGSVGHGFSCA